MAAGKQEQHEPRCPHTFRMAYLKTAMMAALMRPEMGTVTNQAMKMLRKRRQSTAFLERSQPTETTEPTCPRSRSRAQHGRRMGLTPHVSTTPQPFPGVPTVLPKPLGTQAEQSEELPARGSNGCLAEPRGPSKGFCHLLKCSLTQPWAATATAIEMQMAELGPEGQPAAYFVGPPAQLSLISARIQGKSSMPPAGAMPSCHPHLPCSGLC